MRWPAARFNDEWHRWFAWYPITMRDQRIWLEVVERQRDASWYDWRYRNPEN